MRSAWCLLCFLSLAACAQSVLQTDGNSSNPAAPRQRARFVNALSGHVVASQGFGRKLHSPQGFQRRSDLGNKVGRAVPAELPRPNETSLRLPDSEPELRFFRQRTRGDDSSDKVDLANWTTSTTEPCIALTKEEKLKIQFLPILEVLDLYPGVSGFCLFSYLGFWADDCERSRADNYYPRYAFNQRANGHFTNWAPHVVDPKHRLKHAKLRVAYDNESFTTYNNVYTYDDFYCHANGWIELPSDIMYNATAVEEISENECDGLSILYPDASNWTLSGPSQFKSWKEEEGNLLMNIWWHDQEIHKSDARAHAFFKCLLGGLGCDIAYCALNFCMLPDGRIGHNEECPDDLPPSKYRELDPSWVEPKDKINDWYAYGRKLRKHRE